MLDLTYSFKPAVHTCTSGATLEGVLCQNLKLWQSLSTYISILYINSNGKETIIKLCIKSVQVFLSSLIRQNMTPVQQEI